MSERPETVSELPVASLDPGGARTVVFAGSFWTGSTENGLSAGFRKLDWTIQEIDLRDHFDAGGPLWRRVAGRLTKRFNRAIYEAAVEAACRHLKPDILFTVKGSHLTRPTLDRVRDLGAQIVCFWPDYHFGYPDLDVDALLDSDLFITSKSFQMPWLAERGLKGRSAFVAHGYNPAAHAPVLKEVSESDYTADIRYIGNHSPHKQAWIEELDRRLPDANLRVVGNRWRRALGKGTAARIVEADQYMAASYALAVQTARINIAVHFGKAANGWEDLVSTRTFEIPACGGFMLHIDNDEVREYYDVGREIDVFTTPEELADKCRFYLANDETRRRMAQRGYERCVPRYSQDNRAREIDEAMTSFLGIPDTGGRTS